MIISRTPLRVSFVGGGSDIKSFYGHEAGIVVSTAINKYIYITVNQSFDGKISVRYSKEERVDDIDDLENNLIREALRLVHIEGGVDISSTSDIPSEGSGLGSSSSYLVGVLHALYAFKGRSVSAKQLAQDACKIEVDILKKPIGKQDQYIAAFGGFQTIQFNPDDSVYVDPIIFSAETRQELQERLLLLYTGITRSSDTILAKQNANLIKYSAKRKTLSQMVQLAREMQLCLQKNKLDTFGELLDQNWKLKKEMADGITSPLIDQWYSIAKKNGAIGGKLLGAGGGGFLLFYAPRKHHKEIIKALPRLRATDLTFEPQGSKIIFVGQ
ncbi:MAG: GHMP kinase [Patescibacteria group bacterium]